MSAPGAPIVTLIKPQFEAGRGAVGQGGVVRDATTHERVLLDLVEWGQASDEHLIGLEYSPLRGPAGNIEFLGLWTEGSGASVSADSIQSLVSAAHRGLAE